MTESHTGATGPRGVNPGKSRYFKGYMDIGPPPCSSTAMSQKIGMVGVGRMGANMARRLKDCGHEVSVVQDIHAPAAEELAEELGCTAASSLSEVTANADIIFTVVTDDGAMREIFTADNLLKDASGKVFINCATLSPELQQEVDAACQAAGASALEACMASSIPQARNGELYLMIGGDEAVFNANEALLEDLSASLRYIGPIGKAAQVKALVNMVMNINTAALAEGLGLGQALGLDLGMLCEVFSQTGANSRVLETDSDDMKDRDHDCCTYGTLTLISGRLLIIIRHACQKK